MSAYAIEIHTPAGETIIYRGPTAEDTVRLMRTAQAATLQAEAIVNVARINEALQGVADALSTLPGLS